MQVISWNFWRAEEGAITVDYIVLTAAAVFLVLTLVIGTIGGATEGLAGSIVAAISNIM
ncbi:hypothetical protein [Pseudaestuariivita rosea]|uniref:hypothetical protein n=1 Tax=Pseudaestuariivita rosea TaxID=2763263 RepID=UPI001ABB9106|nr:hypothetical protein [Pseudaestuariivita rosea]